MNERFLILVLTTAANVTLALTVWLRSASQNVNQYFAFFSVSVASWTLSNGLVAAYADTPWGIIWARTAFASASLIPIAFFLFVSVFPVRQPQPSARIVRAYVISGTLAALASLTPLVAANSTSLNGVLRMTYGPLHPLFGLYLVSTLAYSLVILYQKLALLSGLERLQVRYVFLAVSLPLLGGTVTNLFIPLVFHSSQFSQYGPLFSIPMMAVIAHAIIRYRLLNIRLVIRRGFAYLLAILTAAAVFTFLLNLASGLLVLRPQELPLSLEIGLVLLIAIAFQPLLKNIQSWLDRYLFREPYDYQRVVREITRTMASILDPQPLLSYACSALIKTVRPEHATVYTTTSDSSTFKRLITHAALPALGPPPDETVSSTSVLASCLSRDQRPFLAQELRLVNGREAASLLHEIQGLNSDLILPLIQEGTLTGFFAIGRKLSGDPYFAEDLDLLTTLLGQATIALKNAQLYSQVVLANEHVENILTTIESGVIAVDAAGRVTLFNAAAAKLTGLDSALVRSRSLDGLPPPLADLLAATLTDMRPRTQIETTILSSSGAALSVICSTTVLRNSSSAMLGAVAVFSDLTRLKTLEDEKRQAERLASIGALASGIAHEIKNPLVAIKTFAELLPERFSEEDFRNDFAKVVITEIERIDDLVARLRGFATPSILSPVDILTPLDETIALLRGQLEQARIRIMVNASDSLPLISGDISQLKQLFLNLLINAIEAMSPGGDITISVFARTTATISSLHIEIVDSGPGIPEPLLSQVFEPFVTTKKSGSGLGLSICRGIADAHRATIRASNNRRGRGTTISLDFPALEEVALPLRLL